MGTRRGRTRQVTMWVPTADLPKSAGHPFYERLNRVLDDAGFDAFVEAQCASFYADGVGRPSLAPGRYFRLLLLGYFEGLDSERAIAWRAADSLSIRTFLDFALHEAPPDHSTLSRTRRLIDLETHQAVFTWVLQRLADATLVVGRTVGIDATTLEANAAMRSIVRRDTGESYDAFLTRLAEASGLSTPTRAELARFDRTRKKKGSNADWTHPHDPDAKIAKMKDGRTHLAHTAEHAVDLETGAIVGVTVQDASAGDTTTLVDTLVTAAEQVEAVGVPGIVEVVADKGYHSNETMVGFAAIGVRSYVSEPDRGRRHWKGQAAARDAVYANPGGGFAARRGKRLLRQRGELLERPNAHLYETGRMRRVHLRGHPNILNSTTRSGCRPGHIEALDHTGRHTDLCGTIVDIDRQIRLPRAGPREHQAAGAEEGLLHGGAHVAAILLEPVVGQVGRREILDRHPDGAVAKTIQDEQHLALLAHARRHRLWSR